MDNFIDFFDQLPDEVIHLIFACISDCKSLVRCMSVSKAFLQYSVRVSSLSIVCPGNFSSYDERLHKIYSMVKPFRCLQSLVVRVGQPKEEPPSWARCMRYVELGGSVEKFVFMAAKSGDFSELDSTLLGLDNLGCAEESKDVVVTSQTGMIEGDALCNPEQSTWCSEDSEKASDSWIDIESDEGGGHMAASSRNTERQSMQDSNDGIEVGKRFTCGKMTQSDARFFREASVRKQLTDFSLRQVIAPSEDVLKRMLPVIHFAIVQGLNELRDSIPLFVAQFPMLRRLLVVDMMESITVYLREHHIQEIRLSYLHNFHAATMQSKDVLWNTELYRGSGHGKRLSAEVEKGIGAGEFTKKCDEQSTGLANLLDSGNISKTNVLGATQNQIDTSSLKDRLRNKHLKGKDSLHQVTHTAEENGGTNFECDPWDLSCQTQRTNLFFDKRGAEKGKGKFVDYKDDWNQLGSSQLIDTSCGNSDVTYDCSSSRRSLSENVLDNLPSDNAGEGNFVTASSSSVSTSFASIEDGDIEEKQQLVDCSGHSEERVPNTCVDGCVGCQEPFKDGGSMVYKQQGWHFTEPWAFNSKNHDEGMGWPSLCRIEETWIGEEEDGYRWKGCRPSREAKMDLANRHPFKRSLKFESCKTRESNRIFRSPCTRRCNDNSIVFGSHRREDGQAHRHLIPTAQSIIDARTTGESNFSRSATVANVGHKETLDLKESDSFDYTFWRAEQVVACNYSVSDISMCIATRTAKPLEEADKEILSCSALAGPLLVATVSHVNKHYACHNL